jgi:hypothetical protein
MNTHQLYHHEGCHSGQCVWQAHGLACLIARELSNKENHLAERRRTDELLAEAGRLLEEGRQVGRIEMRAEDQ